MRQAALIAASSLALVAALTIGDGLYIVNEADQVIITQFGKPVGDPVTKPGLKMKIPILHKTNSLDKRILWWDGVSNEMPTGDQHFVVIDACAQWRIADPLLFFQRVHDERGALSRLDDLLDAETRKTVAKYGFVDIVRSSNREFESPPAIENAIDKITAGRETLEREIWEGASARTGALGIEIRDFRFQRINYAETERQTVYDRMISERMRMAEEIRAKGEAEAARITRESDRGR